MLNSYKKRNDKARFMFNQWYLKNHKPQKKLLAENLGLDYEAFRHWTTGRTINLERLLVIEKFLEEQYSKEKSD